MGILEQASELAGKARSEDYGHPFANHAKIAAMWTAQLSDKLLPGVAIDPREVALMMISVKLAREAHRPKLDNLVDIVGYVRCVEQIDEHTAEGDEYVDAGVLHPSA